MAKKYQISILMDFPNLLDDADARHRAASIRNILIQQLKNSIFAEGLDGGKLRIKVQRVYSDRQPVGIHAEQVDLIRVVKQDRGFTS